MKMDTDLAMYQRCHKIVDSFIYGCGVWPHPEDTGPLYKCFIVYSLFMLGAIATKCLFDAMMNLDNVSALFYGLRGAAAMGGAIVRLISYLTYRKDLIFLENELCAKFKEELNNEKIKPVLLKNISLYRNLIYFIVLSTSLAVILYFIPYALIIFKYKKNIQLYSGKYPFPVEPRGTVYWLIIAFETSSFWYLISVFGAVDNNFGMHCFRISGFLRVATRRFNDLNADDPNCKDELRECVSIHQMVLRAKTALEKVYGYIIIWNYCISAIIMCSILWEVNQAKTQLTLLRIFFAAFYLFMKLAQTFVYAYFGSAISAESEKYRDATYMLNWPGSGNVRLMKDVLIVLLQRTVSLKACGFFFITMTYFEKICNTTLSYFFLIQTLDEKN